jgi:hypothetical protein
MHLSKKYNTLKNNRYNIVLSHVYYLRNKSWKPECVGSFNMDWQILIFYPEPEAGDKIYISSNPC